MLNPYIAGNPISNRTGFFGREDVFREVMRVLRHFESHSIVLYGQRRIGKTSVLLQLEQQLARAGLFTPVYFDLQDKADKSLRDVLYELAQRIGLVVGGTTPKRELFDEEGNYFRQTFLPQAAEAATGGGLVLLFDEFDVLDSPQRTQAGRTFFPYLRQWMTNLERVQFVFVIGRRPEDLSISTIATFKGIQAKRISLLDHKITTHIVRQAERMGSLNWPEMAVERVWFWTRGQPFFTQLLCWVVWENAYEVYAEAGSDESDDIPIVRPEDVDRAVTQTLEQGANAFYWIWGGLPPAERVVMAAMAEGKADLITNDKLVEILNQNGVRLIVRELELAPESLIEWELLQPADGGYQFTVPLLRRWVKTNRPLRRVKEELDRLDPLADGLFQTGQHLYGLKRSKLAESQLRQALQFNPNHLKAQLLLGQILFESGRLEEAVAVLEEAYQYDSSAVRADLVRVYLALANAQQEEEKKLATYNRILVVDPGQPVADVRRQSLLAARRERHITALLAKAKVHQQQEEWRASVAIYEALLAESPEDVKWQAHLEYVKIQATLAQRYDEALGALEVGKLSTAQKLLTQVVCQQPTYKEAVRHLYRAIGGEDVLALKEENARLQEELDKWQSLGGVLDSSNTFWEKEHLPWDALPSQDAATRSLPLAEKKESPDFTLEPLVWWYTVDHFRLLYWLYMAPQTLRTYRIQYGMEAVYPIGRWLANGLIWTPLFVSTAALGWQWGLTPKSSLLLKVEYYQFGTALLASVWFFSFHFAEETNERILTFAFVIALVISTGITFYVVAEPLYGLELAVATSVGLTAAISTAPSLIKSVALGVTLGVGLGLVFAATLTEGWLFGLTTGFVASVTSGITVALVDRSATNPLIGILEQAFFILLLGAAGGTVGALIGESVAQSSSLDIMTCVLEGIAVGLFTGAGFALILQMALYVKHKIEYGHASQFSRSLFFVLILAYCVLLWNALFG